MKWSQEVIRISSEKKRHDRDCANVREKTVGHLLVWTGCIARELYSHSICESHKSEKLKKKKN